MPAADAATAASPFAANGRILFTTSRTGPYSIWSVASSGGLASPAVGGTTSVSDATISPDGRRVVFQRNVDGTLDLGAANLDGTGEVNLTNSAGVSEQAASFSPDGRRIAFVRTSPNFDIWVMNADGSGQVNVTGTPASEAAVDWSPDGRRLAITRGPDLILKDLATGVELNLTASRPDGYGGPSFSPDGQRIAVTRIEGPDTDVALLNIDGSSGPDVAATAVQENEPAFSPDGTRIAYRHDLNDVFVAPAGGGAGVNLTPGTPGTEAEPAWQPVFTCAGRPATIVGSDAPETLRGTKRADVIVANGGNDRVLGLKGADRLCGGLGRDRLIGGKGNDRLVGGPDADRLIGGAGKDRLKGGAGKDKQRQ